MSEQTKHTDGPWSLPHFAEPEVNCECGYVLCDHLMGAVATVHCSGEGGDWRNGANPKFEEACANARLIAAAPEMLAALKAVEEWWLSEDKHIRYGAPFAIFATRAAIAKATGSTP